MLRVRLPPITEPLKEQVNGSCHPLALFASVLVLLLIVCVNLGNLVLARAHARVFLRFGASRVGKLFPPQLTRSIGLGRFSFLASA